MCFPTKLTGLDIFSFFVRLRHDCVARASLASTCRAGTAALTFPISLFGVPLVAGGTDKDALFALLEPLLCAFWQYLREHRPDALVVVMALFPRADPRDRELPYPWPLIDEVGGSTESIFGMTVFWCRC